jgi:hypothetical protein
MRVLLVAVVLGVSSQALGVDTSLRGATQQTLLEEPLFEEFGSDNAAEAIEAFNARLNAVSNNSQVAINWDGPAVTDLTQGKTAAMPGDLFLSNRQVLYENLACSEDNFQTLSEASKFNIIKLNTFGKTPSTPFSPNVTCGPKSVFIRKTSISFTLADLETPGSVFGFGTVFNLPSGNPGFLRRARLNFFQGDKKVASIKVQKSKPGAQVFVGAIFEKPIVSKVEIDYGLGPGFPFNAPADNWFFDLAQN